LKSKKSAEEYRARSGRLLPIRPLPTALVAGLAALAALGTGATPAPAASPVAATSAAVVAKAMSAGAVSRTVTLVTGDRVVATTIAGQTHYAIDPATPGDAGFQTFRDAQGDYHVVPALAQPYLGAVLSPSLFDVTAQLRTPAAAADEQLTRASSTALVAALREAVGADVRAGRRPGTTAPRLDRTVAADLSRSARVADLATTLPAASSATGIPQRIVQLDVTDQSGKPANGAAVLINTDSGLRFLHEITINGGMDRVALPVGDYSVIFSGSTFSTSGSLTSSYELTKSDFTVPATGTVPDVVLDGRTAVQLHVATPLPATTDLTNVGWYRSDGSAAAGGTGSGGGGGGGGAGVVVDGVGSDGTGGGGNFPDVPAVVDYTQLGSIPFAMNAQPAAKVGALATQVQWIGGDTKDTYRYDLVFPSTSVPDVSAFRVTAAQLAAEHYHYYADPAAPTDSSTYEDPLFTKGPQALDTSGDVPQSMPGDVTDYFNSAPNMVRMQQDIEGSNISFFGDAVAFTPGTTGSADWGRGPLAPAVGQHTLLPGVVVAGDGGNACAACVAGTDLQLNIDDFDGSNPGQDGVPDLEPSGTPLQPNPYLVVDQNGQQLLETTQGSGFTETGAPAGGAKYDVSLTVGPVPGVSLSTSTATQWTFSTTPAAESGAALTPLGSCTGESTATPCEVLPLLNITRQLAESETGTAAPGAETMGLAIGHASYNGTGSHAAITSASVQVSFDGGTTWQTVKLTATGAASSGNYTATWTDPAADAGTYPSIRVSATDAVGGSINQTITHAYEIVKGA